MTIELCAGKRWQRERQLFSSSLSVAMSFSPAFDRPLPRIEASLRWRTNKERTFPKHCHSGDFGRASSNAYPALASREGGTRCLLSRKRYGEHVFGIFVSS